MTSPTKTLYLQGCPLHISQNAFTVVTCPKTQILAQVHRDFQPDRQQCGRQLQRPNPHRVHDSAELLLEPGGHLDGIPDHLRPSFVDPPHHPYFHEEKHPDRSGADRPGCQRCQVDDLHTLLPRLSLPAPDCCRRMVHHSRHVLGFGGRAPVQAGYRLPRYW